ncbi:MAG TPA: DUF488 domain-containing protein [Xanthobacteraceae bacterium]|jgi:uncharacterized protein (DUF488 family)|nr:DUF488 domain-containing protein [Xanthobacteraceae bacterium]
MTSFDLFSIGHSNVSAECFLALLQSAGVNAIADVRSVPVSRFCPWFSAKNLAPFLAQQDIGYLPYGETLGGRPSNSSLYCDGIADYEAMARQPEFQRDLERLRGDMARSRVCIMCAERDPLDCHRCLLVARELATGGVTIGHILHGGTITPHALIEQQLLLAAEDETTPDLFVTGQNERIAAAYRWRARAVAYRVKQATRPSFKNQ